MERLFNPIRIFLLAQIIMLLRWHVLKWYMLGMELLIQQEMISKM